MGRLDVRNVSKVYPGTRGSEAVTALSQVTFSVEENEFCCLLGHSGCGKTTLLNMVAGFEQPSGGQLTLDGQPVGGPDWHKAVVFQDYALFPWATVYENITFGLEMKKVPAAERKRIAEHHIHLVGLAGFEHRFPHQLSGGMRQRVAIARALAVNPSVLLMDEPFAALDPQNRSFMQDELVKIWQKQPKTVILVTHSIDEAIKLSDRIIVLSRRPGRVKENITVRLPRPRHEEDPAVVALKRRLRSLIQDEFAAEGQV